MFKQRVFVAVAATLTAIALVAPVGAYQNRPLQALAHNYGVTIFWEATHCSLISPGALACFLPATPNTIFVNPKLKEWEMHYAVLHELGHVLQHRAGQPLDECAADVYAHEHGAIAWSYCDAGAIG